MRIRFADPCREDHTSPERPAPPHECPLCGQPAGSEDDVYCHLMIDHRKSTLSSALIGTDEADTRASATLPNQ